MAITSAGKEYIATQFGIGDPRCFVYTGLTWTAVAVDDTTVDEAGGTYSIVARLVSISIYKEIRLKTPRTGTYTYAALKAANGGQDINLAEAKSEIADHDGYPAGEDQYCIGVTPTPTPTPVPGKATLFLFTDPGCCAAYLDCDPKVPPCPAVITCTEDVTLGKWNEVPISAPARHYIYVTRAGMEYFRDSMEDFPDGIIPEGAKWYVYATLIGKDTALLTVNAYKDEEKPAKVPITNAGVKKGTKFMGFAPYSDYWNADPLGTKYDLNVVAEDRESYAATITLYKDTPKTVDAYLKVKKLEVKIKIAPGVAYLDEMSLKDGDVLYIGSIVDGWVRVETFLETPTVFYAILTFLDPVTKLPVNWGGRETIYTQGKLLFPGMGATERHLDWPYTYSSITPPGQWKKTTWIVPDKPGEYLLQSELRYEV